VGKHNYLKKNEGKKAAQVSGEVFNQKVHDKIAQEDIRKFSLLHARKEGLVSATPAPMERKPSVTYIEVDADGKPIEAPAQRRVSLPPIEAPTAAPAPAPAPAPVAAEEPKETKSIFGMDVM
jgi:hypothetical protein